MTTKKPTKHKPEPRPTPPVAIDKSETLARADAAAAEAADSLASAINSLPDDPGGHRKAAIAATMTVDGHPTICPTCGTAQTGNRCDVCGRQEHDT